MDLLLEEDIVEKAIPRNTLSRKFAISVPDDVFQAVEAQAEKMGTSRSQFFADAARRYLDALSRADEIDEINEFVAGFGDNTTDPESSWGTTVVASMTTRLDGAQLPAMVFVPRGTAGHTKESVINMTNLATVSKSELVERMGTLPSALWQEVVRAMDQMMERPG